MFSVIKGLPASVIGISALGKVQSQDYENVLSPLIRETLAARGKLRLVMQFGPQFTGYSAGAIWQDAKFGFSHRGDFEKIAVVADIAWVRHAVQLFGPLVRCPVRVFAVDDFATAKAWAAA